MPFDITSYLMGDTKGKESTPAEVNLVNGQGYTFTDAGQGSIKITADGYIPVAVSMTAPDYTFTDTGSGSIKITE